MSTLTLSMIVKNEEKYLRNCLESVKDIVNEIVIVDTGSTDKTKDIAKNYNAKIIELEWQNDFSFARNIALENSTSEWILYLDADERLNENSQNEIKKLTETNQKLGINCNIKNIDEFQNSPKLMKYIRLFKNDINIKFSGRAHEQIEPSLFENNYKIVDSSIEIVHLGYNMPKEELKKKAERNLKLLLADYNEKKTSYLAYQIANSYSILDDKEMALKFFREAILDKNLRNEFKVICYLHLADNEMRLNNLAKAFNFFQLGINLYDKNTLLNMLGAQIFSKMNNGKDALNLCKKAYENNLELSKCNNSNNIQEIIIDDKKIIYQGMLLSIQFRDKEVFNFYLHELQNYDQQLSIIFEKLKNNKDLTKADVEELGFLTTDDNLELVLKLVEHYFNIEIKLDYYSSIYNKFFNSLKYVMSFGSFLISIHFLDEAEIILESALDLEEFGSAILYYLASIYIKKDKIDKLKDLIKTAENKLNPNFKNSLVEFKSKVLPLINYEIS